MGQVWVRSLRSLVRQVLRPAANVGMAKRPVFMSIMDKVVAAVTAEPDQEEPASARRRAREMGGSVGLEMAFDHREQVNQAFVDVRLTGSKSPQAGSKTVAPDAQDDLDKLKHLRAAASHHVYKEESTGFPKPMNKWAWPWSSSSPHATKKNFSATCDHKFSTFQRAPRLCGVRQSCCMASLNSSPLAIAKRPLGQGVGNRASGEQAGVLLCG